MTTTDNKAQAAYDACMKLKRLNARASYGGRARAIAADREERQAWEALISIIGPQRSAASPAIMALHADYRRRFP